MPTLLLTEAELEAVIFSVKPPTKEYESGMKALYGVVDKPMPDFTDTGLKHNFPESFPLHRSQFDEYELQFVKCSWGGRNHEIFDLWLCFTKPRTLTGALKGIFKNPLRELVETLEHLTDKLLVDPDKQHSRTIKTNRIPYHIAYNAEKRSHLFDCGEHSKITSPSAEVVINAERALPSDSRYARCRADWSDSVDWRYIAKR
jgi:hypothetical protein